MQDRPRSYTGVNGALAAETLPLPDVAEESSLAQRIRLKDEQAMGELYGLHGALAYSVLLRVVRNPCIAEELMQEVFLRVWTCIDTFDEHRGGLKKWIVAIARNKAVDYLRSAGAQVEQRACRVNELRRSLQENSFEDRIVTEDLVRVSRRALQQLAGQQRRVVRLTYFDGKTQSQIAAEIQAPLGSVKTWARLGLRKLREELYLGRKITNSKCR